MLVSLSGLRFSCLLFISVWCWFDICCIACLLFGWFDDLCCFIYFGFIVFGLD